MSNSTAICYYDDAEKLAELAEIARSMGITISLPNTDEPSHSERIKTGLERAKREGKKLGRKTNVTEGTKATVLELRNHGYGIKRIAKTLRIGVGTTSAILKAA